CRCPSIVTACSLYTCTNGRLQAGQQDSFIYRNIQRNPVTHVVPKQSNLVGAPSSYVGFLLFARDPSIRNAGKPHRSFGMWWLCFSFYCLPYGSGRYQFRQTLPCKATYRL